MKKFYHTVAMTTAILAACAMPCTAGAMDDVAREFSPEAVMEDVANALDGVDAIDGELNLDLGATLMVDKEGAADAGLEVPPEIGFSCSVNADFKSVFDGNSHIKGALTVEAPDVEDGSGSQTFDAYLDNTGEKPVSYVNTGAGWEKNELAENVDPDTIKASLQEALDGIGKNEDLELEETELDGKSMIKVSSSVDYSDVDDAVSFYQNVDGAEVDQIADAEGAKLFVAAYIDRSTSLLSRLEMGMAEDSGDISADIGVGTLSIEDFMITLEMNGYNEFSSVEIPDNVVGSVSEILYDDNMDIAPPEEMETETGEEELVTELTSPDGTHVASYDVTGTDFGTSYADDNYLSLYGDIMATGSPEITMTYIEGIAAEETANNQHDSDKDYYSSSDFTDVAFSDVAETEVGGYKAYWYSDRHTDAEYGYKVCDYDLYIDLGEDQCLSFEYDTLFGEDDEAPADDSAFFDAIGCLSIN